MLLRIWVGRTGPDSYRDEPVTRLSNRALNHLKVNLGSWVTQLDLYRLIIFFLSESFCFKSVIYFLLFIRLICVSILRA